MSLPEEERKPIRIRDDLIEYTKRHLDELLTSYGEIDVIFLGWRAQGRADSIRS